MTTQSSLAALTALSSALPAERARDVTAYVLDGVTPGCALRPESIDEVVRVLGTADAAGIAVTPLGARTASRLGRPLEAYDLALDMTALDRVIAYEPADLTITVQAGMSLAQLQAVLREHGQYLPADAPPDDRVTIGGLLASARPGAWRGHVPAARDLVLGITVVGPSGVVTHSGGRVVKNVSGYDLHRMHTGALGALGVIIEASFKLAPKPAQARSFAIACATLEQASELAFRLWDQSLPLRALSLLSAGASSLAGLPATPHALIECVGGDAVLARCTESVHREAVLTRATAAAPAPDEAWATLRTRAGDLDGLDGVVLRLGVPSSRVAAAIEEAERVGCTAWGHLAAGSVVAHASSLDATTVASLRAYTEAAGGFLQIDSAPASLRLALDPFGASETALVRALKHEFDPRGTLSRGRWREGV